MELHTVYYSETPTESHVFTWDLNEGDTVELIDPDTGETAVSKITWVKKINHDPKDKFDRFVHLGVEDQARSYVVAGRDRVYTGA